MKRLVPTKRSIQYLPPRGLRLFGSGLEYYGTGSCFVFRMTPQPQRWLWATSKEDSLGTPSIPWGLWPSGPSAPSPSPSLPGGRQTSSSFGQSVLSDEGLDAPAEWELQNDMFINGRHDQLTFGGGGDGPALELSADLQTAATYRCATYQNGPAAPLWPANG